MEKDNQPADLKQPIVEHDTGALPSAVTFFLNTKQRRAGLGVLNEYSDDRTRAILMALGIIETE